MEFLEIMQSILFGAPGLESNWWRHKPEAVIKHDGHEVVWDQFVAPIASGIKDRRPDIIWRKPKEILIVEISCPADENVLARYEDKIKKYVKLRENEAEKYGKRARVLPIVVGATGAIPKTTSANLRELIQKQKIRTEIVQKLVALETIGVINAAA